MVLKYLREKITLNCAIYIIFLLGIFARISHFGSIPDGILADEAGSAIDAYLMVNYGVDRYQNSLPIYFLNYGGGQSALYPYLCALFIYIFGFNTIAIRLPILIFNILFAIFGLLIINKIFKNENIKTVQYAKLFFITLYAICPYPFMASRFGLDCNLMLPMSTIFLYFMLIAIEKKRSFYFAAAGIFGGITLYSYAISYLVLPVFLILLLIYLIYLKTVSVKNVMFFVAPLFIIALPLLIVQYVNIFDKPQMEILGFTATKLPLYRSGEITFSNIPQNMFFIVKSALFYDWIDVNTIMSYYTFYPMSVIFFFRGLFYFCGNFTISLSEKKYMYSAIIFFWLTAEFFVCSLLGKTDVIEVNPNTNKINGIFFSIMFFIVLGLIKCFSDIAKFKIKKYAAYVTIFLYATFTVSFFNYYFHNYNPQFFTDKLCNDTIEFINNNEELKHKKIFADFHYPFLLFSSINLIDSEKIPLPIPPTLKNDYDNFTSAAFDILPQDLPQNAAYICHKDKYELIEKYRRQNYKIVEFKNYVLILLTVRNF